MEKIRIGIDLDHVIRDINRQIVKYYQKDYDESIDIDSVNFKDNALTEVCHFDSKIELDKFLYEDYALEIFGHAGQMTRNLSRDINKWIQDLTNQEKYDVDIFFFSMKEFNLTIQSSYFFLSKIGTRVRKVIFPKTLAELAEFGDLYITANQQVAMSMKNNGKSVVFVKMDFNASGQSYSDWVVNDLREFLDYDNKLEKITNLLKENNICQNKDKRRLSWISMRSWISYFLQKKKEVLMLNWKKLSSRLTKKT